MLTVVPSTTLTRRPHHSHSTGAASCTSRPSARINRNGTASGSRARALQYGPVSSSSITWPRRAIQAAIRLTAARQERSGLSTCQKKAQKVSQGV